MGEPAKGLAAKSDSSGKSMEDILSSIRQIIAKESNDTKSGPSTEAESVAQPPSKSGSAGNASSLASLVAGTRKPKEAAQQQESVPAVAEKAEVPVADKAAAVTPVAEKPVASAPSQTPAGQSSGGLAALAEKMRNDRFGASNRSAEPARREDDVKNEATAAPAAEEPNARLTPKVSQASNASDNNGTAAMSFSQIAELAKEGSVSKAQPPAAEAKPAEAAAPTKVDAPAVAKPVETSISKAAEPPRAAPSVPKPEVKADRVEDFREALVAPSTQAAVSGSMDRLKKSVEDIDSAQIEAVLRPLLKEWIDSNLPAMVERMVSEEIKAISRGK